ncbi:hypothetical protein EDD21DRAFT_4777 [Dissophora ornata]|nr:hypothetical protein EDD21DRAFT_4777 [Dissophora ornata]
MRCLRTCHASRSYRKSTTTNKGYWERSVRLFLFFWFVFFSSLHFYFLSPLPPDYHTSVSFSFTLQRKSTRPRIMPPKKKTNTLPPSQRALLGWLTNQTPPNTTSITLEGKSTEVVVVGARPPPALSTTPAKSFQSQQTHPLRFSRQVQKSPSFVRTPSSPQLGAMKGPLSTADSMRELQGNHGVKHYLENVLVEDQDEDSGGYLNIFKNKLRKRNDTDSEDDFRPSSEGEDEEEEEIDSITTQMRGLTE